MQGIALQAALNKLHTIGTKLGDSVQQTNTEYGGNLNGQVTALNGMK